MSLVVCAVSVLLLPSHLGLEQVITPVVKDNGMQVAVAAESIVTEETHDFYMDYQVHIWPKIQPRFHLHNIDIRFTNQKITSSHCSPRAWH
jgi:hypothetical protein